MQQDNGMKFKMDKLYFLRVHIYKCLGLVIPVTQQYHTKLCHKN